MTKRKYNKPQSLQTPIQILHGYNYRYKLERNKAEWQGDMWLRTIVVSAVWIFVINAVCTDTAIEVVQYDIIVST